MRNLKQTLAVLLLAGCALLSGCRGEDDSPAVTDPSDSAAPSAGTEAPVILEPGEQNGVIIARDNFLFSADSQDYAYMSNYQGKLSLTADQLTYIERTLFRRQTAFANDGAELVVVMVPNAQTIYSEYLSDRYGEPGNTQLSQLTAHMRASDSAVTYIDLTEALLAAKAGGAGRLYNTTDNSLTAEGAYYAYEAIYGQLPKALTENNPFRGELKTMITASSGSGMALAQQAGVTVNNSGSSLALTDPLFTRIGTPESGFVSTFVSMDKRDSLSSRPEIAVNYGREADLESFLPYFSSTWGNVGYKQGWEFSPAMMDSIAPDAVIQIIYEDQLATLLDAGQIMSYLKNLNPGDDPTMTGMPQVTASVITSPGEACLVGLVEEGAVITVSGEGFEPFQTTAQSERFFIPVKVKEGTHAVVYLTAKLEGKDESVPLETVVNAAASQNLTVFAGLGSQLHYPDTLADYYCTNLIPDGQMKSLDRLLRNKMEKIRAAAGKDTKLVYLFAPDGITAYPETATPEMVANRKGTYSRLQQFTDHFKDDPDIYVINSAEIILANKDRGKMYYQTDTHWNELGAYHGYYALMTRLAADFPDAAPREIDQYNIFQGWESGGDLVSFLGCGNDVGSEYKTYCRPRYTNRATITQYFNGTPNPAYSDMIRCDVDDDALGLNLPTAMMLCDSFGANLYPFVSDAFDLLVRQTMWDYATYTNVIADVQPDYYIHCFVERNLMTVQAG